MHDVFDEITARPITTKLSHFFIFLFARQTVKTCTMMEYRLVSCRITDPIRRFPRDRLPIPSWDFYGGSFEKKLNENRSRKCLWEMLEGEKSDQRRFPLFVRFRGVLLWLKPLSGALCFERPKYRVSNDFRTLFLFSLSIDIWVKFIARLLLVSGNISSENFGSILYFDLYFSFIIYLVNE